MLVMENKGQTIARWKSEICAYLVCLVGAVVLFGWYSHNTSLVQIHATFVPMQYNTAAGFLLSGLSIVALLYHFKKVAQACAAIVFILGLFTLIQYIFSINLGIDQLLMEHYITVKTSHPGRMAPNTALCFMLTGLCLLAYLHLKTKFRLVALAVIPTTIFTLATLALLGYLSNVDTLYGWGKLTKMALHTSVAFMLIGLSLLSLAWRESQVNQTPVHHWLPFAIGTMLLLATLLTWQAVTINESNKQRNTLERESSFVASNLETNLRHLYQAVQRMAERIVLQDTFNASTWNAEAQKYFSDFPYLIAMNVQDGNNVKHQIYSPSWLHYSPTLSDSIKNEQDRFSLLINQNFGMFVPFALNAEHYVGWLSFKPQRNTRQLNVLVDYRMLIYDILEQADLFSRLELSVLFSLETIYHSSGYKDSKQGHLGQYSEFSFIGHNISIEAYPSTSALAYWQSSLPNLVLAVGLLISLLITWLIHLLQSLIEKHQLVAFNQQLQAEVRKKQQAQSALVASNQKLLSSNRDLEQFAFIASHDLKEPLRKIQAFGNLLAGEYADKIDEEGQYYIQTMQNASERMGQLITDLLAFSRISTRGKQPTQCDLNDLLKSIQADLELQINEEQAKITVNNLPKVKADPSQLSLVLQNLISNAIKFRHPDLTPEVEVSARQEQGFWFISVCDNGMGFDEQFSDKIFQIFQRLHNKQKISGTGIGLAICRRVMERHGGDITVTSTPGKGSCFTLKLPVEPLMKDADDELQTH